MGFKKIRFEVSFREESVSIIILVYILNRLLKRKLKRVIIQQMFGMTRKLAT